MLFKKIARELIFKPGEQFESCHASTLTLLPGGRDILAAWFAGSREGADDTAIWSSRRIDGRWSCPVKIADNAGMPHWNPSLFREKDGTILLFFKTGRKVSKWRTMIQASKDGGLTWTYPKELVPGDCGGRGPVKNKMIKLEDGTYLAPASLEDGIWRAFADITKDRGSTWEKSNEIYIQGIDINADNCPRNNAEYDADKAAAHMSESAKSFKGRGVIQPALWESGAGNVHMLLRSTEGFIFRSDSTDYGKTWSAAYPTSLPNNNSGIDLTKLDDGRLVLVCNPVGANWGPRTPLVMLVSEDNGITWGDQFVLEDADGEFSYPAILAEGNSIFLTYTWKRRSIAFWELRTINSLEDI